MSKYVNKESLKQTLMSHFNLSKSECGQIVDLIFEEMTDCLAQNGKVEISCFGKFELFERKARMGVNPKTLEPMMVPTTFVPKFRASETLKKKCNEQ